MPFAFWEWMIRGEDLPPSENSLPAAFGLMRDGKLKATNGPWRARDLFQAPTSDGNGPIWTFDRFGQTRTRLSGGRTICIGGEHEDDYDPDFYIYNDVVVFGPAGEIEIYGYPKEVFPPTDFHTATFLRGQVLIIGRLGDPDDRRPGHTPVYSLDLSKYRITKVETTGEVPGWVFKHEAELGQDGVVTIREGEIYVERNGERRFRRNLEEFALDTRSWVWRRLTNRNWLQFSIHQQDRRSFDWRKRLSVDQLIPAEIEHSIAARIDRRHLRFLASGVPVSLAVEGRKIEVIVEGGLPKELVWRITEGIRANAERTLEQPCVLEVV